jgi:hypothetical protein
MRLKTSERVAALLILLMVVSSSLEPYWRWLRLRFKALWLAFEAKRVTRVLRAQKAAIERQKGIVDARTGL